MPFSTGGLCVSGFRMCFGSLQRENQAGVLHVQPHVWREGEEEPDEAGGGFLHLRGFLVHEANQV